MLCAVAQDEQKNVEIIVNNDEPVEVKFNSCQLSYSALRNTGSPITLSIDVKNTNGQDDIILFAHEYSRKELRKHKIRFAKKAYGSTSQRIIICEGLDGDDLLQIEPDGNRTLKVDSIDGDIKRLELPIYLAKYKRHILFKRYNIKNRIKIVSNIKFIEDKTDDEYESIKEMCLELISEIEQIAICPRNSHPVSAEKQKEPYTERIMDLKDEISDIKTANGWRERDPDYQRFKELISLLDNVKFNEKYCGKCGQPISESHKCSFCDMTPKDVLTSLQQTYQKLDIGEISKSEAINEVELMYKAWKGGCPKLKQKMDNDSSNRTKVERYYDSIINY